MFDSIDFLPEYRARALEFDDPFQKNVIADHTIEPGFTVEQWLKCSGYWDQIHQSPTLVILNGQALEEDAFQTVIAEHDVLIIVPIPGIADWIVYAALAITAVLAGAAVYMALTVDIPEDTSRQRSPTYDLSYRGNQRRPGEPIPVVYGLTRVYPDVTGSYSYFDNEHNQWIAQIFDISQGTIAYTDADISYEDTPLTNFAEYDIEQLAPGESSKLFPSIVHVSGDVEAVRLPGDQSYSDAYVVSPPGDAVNAIEVDITAPQGFYRLKDSGSIVRRGHDVIIRIEPIDPPGGWWTEVVRVVSNGFDAVRITGRFAVPEGRYQVSVRRTHNFDGRSSFRDEIHFDGLRGFTPSDAAADTSRVAIRARQSDTVGNKALSKFNIKVQRTLPVWNGSTWSDQPTQSAVWAFADVLRAGYGGEMPDSRLDLPALLALAGTPGDVFNGVFDTQITLWEALEMIARPLLARPVQLAGGVHTLIVDAPNVLPSAMFTSTNIVTGSMTIEHIGVLSQTSDGIKAHFLDEDNDYRESVVTAVPSGSAGANLKDVQLRGITNHDLAYDVAIRMANENRWRRKRITWETTISGYIPTFGDVCRVSSFLLAQENSERAVSGGARALNGTTITTFDDLTHLVGVGSLQVFLRDPDGAPLGPYSATVSGAHTINASSVAGWSPYFGNDAPAPQFAIGQTTSFMADVKVMKVTQSGQNLMRIEGVIDNPNVYIGDAPPIPPGGDLPSYLMPTVSNLVATIYGERLDPRVRLAWKGTNADYYLIDESIDSGVTWNRVATAYGNEATILPSVTAETILRVSGVGIFVGPGTTVTLDLLAYTKTPGDVNGLRPKGNNEGAEFVVEWDALPAGIRPEVTVSWNSADKRVVELPAGTTEYRYSYQDAIDDDPDIRFNVLVAKPGSREVTFRLHTINQSDERSITGTAITIKNSQIPQLENIVLQERTADLMVFFDPPPVADFHMVEVHTSLTSGFTPTDSTRRYAGGLGDITLAAVLAYDTFHYVRIVAYDLWGRDELNWSDELTIQTGTGGDWTTVFPDGVEKYMLHDDLSGQIDQNTTDVTSHGGKFAVKVSGDDPNYVAGFGLIADENEEGVTTSEFLVIVDRFGIAAVGAENLSFEVQDGEVRMDGAKILNASIQDAKIGNEIKSLNWDSSGPNYGWRIRKDGLIEANQLKLYDRSGNVILDAGQSTPVYSSDIDNAQQTWAEVSDIPDSLESTALLRFNQSAYGNVQIKTDDPSAGKMRFSGNTVYTSDGVKHTIPRDEYLECFMRPGINEQALVIVFTPTAVGSVIPGHSTSGSTTDNFFLARMHADGRLEAIDGLGTYREFDPDSTMAAVATCSRPAGTSSSTNFATFNSLIGTNLNLPEDGANLSGLDNIIQDGDFAYLSATQADGSAIKTSHIWETQGTHSDIIYHENATSGPSVYLGDNGSADCFLRTAQYFPVGMYSHLYIGVNVWGASNAAGDFHALIQFYDNDYVVMGHENNIYGPQIYGGDNTVGWNWLTAVGDVPFGAVYAKASIRQRNSQGTPWVVNSFVVARAPNTITYETAPTFIKNLAVDTLQIADFAVTQPIVKESGSTTGADDVWHTICTMPAFTPENAGAFVRVDWAIQTTNNIELAVQRNGSDIELRSASNANATGFLVDSPPPSSVTYSLRIRSVSDPTRTFGTTMLATEIKK